MKNVKKAIKGLKQYYDALNGITDVEEFDFIYNIACRVGVDNYKIIKLYQEVEKEARRMGVIKRRRLKNIGNKITATILVSIGVLVLKLDGDITPLIFFTGLATPMFLSKRNWLS